VYRHVAAEGLQFLDQIGDLGVAQVGAVFLEGEAEDDDFGAFHRTAVVDHAFHGLLRDVGGHAVVDLAAGEDDLRVVTEHLGFMGEVIGVDADAVAADQAGTERQEVPLGAGGLQDFEGVDAETVEDQGEFVHQGDVEVALGVLDDLGGFGDLDRTGAVHPGGNHRGIQLGDGFGGGAIIAGDDFHDAGDGAFLVARVDPLGRVADVEVLFPFHAGMLFQQGNAHFFGGAGVDGGFIDHRGALLHVFADDGGGADQGREIGDVSFIDRGGHGDDDEIGAADRGGVAADAEPGRRFQVFRADLAGGVTVVLVMADLGFREVVANGFEFLAEFNCKGQADIAEADDGNNWVVHEVRSLGRFGDEVDDRGWQGQGNQGGLFLDCTGTLPPCLNAYAFSTSWLSTCCFAESGRLFPFPRQLPAWDGYFYLCVTGRRWRWLGGYFKVSVRVER